MKFRSHGTYMRPSSVVAMAMMPVVLVLDDSCRTHRPRTNRMMKPVSKSFTRAGEPCMPMRPMRFKKVPTISRTPPSNPQYLKQA